MKQGPSKKCTAAAAAHVLADEPLRLCLIAHYGVRRLTHGIWTDEQGRKSQRIILHFLDCGDLEEIAGADGFVGGYCTAKGINLNKPSAPSVSPNSVPSVTPPHPLP